MILLSECGIDDRLLLFSPLFSECQQGRGTDDQNREQDDDGDDEALVRATGTVFVLNANKLVTALEKQFETLNTITLDLSGVQRLDETALEKIATLNKKLAAEGKTLIITGENEKTHKRMEKFLGLL